MSFLAVVLLIKTTFLVCASVVQLGNESATDKQGFGMKKYELNLLILLPLTGDEPRNGDACKAAAEIAIREANKRTDILPDYFIKAVYRDEAASGLQSSANTIKFRRQFEEQDDNYYMAPVVIGPFYSTGCPALGRYVQWIDMVQLAIGCNVPSAVGNRRIFPNLYRMRASGEFVAFPILHFIRQVGHWRRFGILSSVTNSFDYTAASFLQKKAVEDGGFEISFFELAPNMDDQTMQRLVASDSRIIVVILTVPALVIEFLCQSYKFGLTGPKYVFILHYAGFYEPTKMGPIIGNPASGIKCSRDVGIEQLHYTIWISWIMVPNSNSEIATQPAALGYNFFEYERMFKAYTNNLLPADYDKRVICQDAAMEALLVLDRADKKLKATQNLTLLDYRNRSREIMLVVNETMATIDYTNIRLGKFRYSYRVEVDDDTHVAVQWLPPNEKRVLVEVRHVGDDTTFYELPHYTLRSLLDPIWFTANGQPPKDKWLTLEQHSRVPIEFFGCIIALSALLTFAQTIALIMAIKGQTFEIFRIAVFVSGCFLLNGASISFAINADSSLLCFIQKILADMGFALTNAYVLASAVYHFLIRQECGLRVQISPTIVMSTARGSYQRSARSHSLPAPVGRRRSSALATIPENSVAPNVIVERNLQRRNTSLQNGEIGIPALFKHKTKIPLVLTVVMTISVVHIATWLAVVPPSSVLKTEKVPHFDAVQDAVTIFKVSVCETFNTDAENAWLLMAVVGHIIVLVVSSIAVYKVRGHMSYTEALEVEYKSLKLAVANVITLLIALIMILVILSSYAQKSIIISVFALLFSGTASGFIFKPIFISARSRPFGQSRTEFRPQPIIRPPL